MQSSARDTTAPIRIGVQRQDDDMIVVEFYCGTVWTTAALDLVVWHGGGFVDTSAAWRIRGTRQLLRFVEVGSA